MISIKQTIVLHAIVIVAALTISAVPSPHAYAVSAQNNRCFSTQTATSTTTSCSANGASGFPLPPGQGGTAHGQDIQTMCAAAMSGGADVKCSGSVKGFGASNVKP